MQGRSNAESDARRGVRRDRVRITRVTSVSLDSMHTQRHSRDTASPIMSGLEIGPSQTDPTTIYDYTFLDFSEKEEFEKS